MAGEAAQLEVATTVAAATGARAVAVMAAAMALAPKEGCWAAAMEPAKSAGLQVVRQAAAAKVAVERWAATGAAPRVAAESAAVATTAASSAALEAGRAALVSWAGMKAVTATVVAAEAAERLHRREGTTSFELLAARRPLSDPRCTTRHRRAGHEASSSLDRGDERHVPLQTSTRPRLPDVRA